MTANVSSSLLIWNNNTELSLRKTEFVYFFSIAKFKFFLIKQILGVLQDSSVLKNKN